MTDVSLGEPVPTTGHQPHDEFDAELSYMDPHFDADPMWTAGRRVTAHIEEETDDEIIVRVEVFDVVNVGHAALIDISEEHAGGNSEEFSDTITIKKADMPLNSPDLDVAPRTHIPTGGKMIPNLREWVEDQPFRASVP